MSGQLGGALVLATNRRMLRGAIGAFDNDFLFKEIAMALVERLGRDAAISAADAIKQHMVEKGVL